MFKKHFIVKMRSKRQFLGCKCLSNSSQLANEIIYPLICGGALLGLSQAFTCNREKLAEEECYTEYNYETDEYEKVCYTRTQEEID